MASNTIQKTIEEVNAGKQTDSSIPPDQQQPNRQRSDVLHELEEEVSAILNGKKEKKEATKKRPSQSQDTKPPEKKPRKRDPDRGGSRYEPRSRCLMFFPTSGHRGFGIVDRSDEYPSIEIVRQMVAYDVQLRLSEPIQDLIDRYHYDEAMITYIHDLIQQHVVEHFGYHDVNALRTALHRFPDDPTVKDAFYVKYNRVTQGLVQEGQCARDVDLFTLDGQPTTLFSHITAGQPLAILAGSTS